MYRVFLFIALLALSSAAPYGDAFSSQSGQRTLVNIREQPDDTDLVDTLGAGYSFFKKQPIGSRPLVQQKLAINEQQAPITALDDTSNQWSAYTQSSAFKQPIPRNFGSAFHQQESQLIVPQEQQQQIIRNVDTSYGQQRQEVPTFVPQPQQPIVRNFDNSYGQQRQELPSFVPERQDWSSSVSQPQQLVRTVDSSYGQRQEIPTFLPQPQPQQPIIRNFDNSYGQQQESQILIQKPLIRTADSSYGQQQESQILLQKPLIRTVDNSYGQRQELPTFVPERQDWSSSVTQPQQLVRTVDNSYGQRQEIPTFLPQPQQPIVRNFDNSYGQQQESQILIQKPLIRTVDNSYGQQQESPVFLQKPLIRTVDSSYGQQQESPVLLQKPLIRTVDSSYGQQQEIPTFLPQPQQPIVRNFDNSYGQQRQELPSFVPERQDWSSSVSQPQQQSLVRNLGHSFVGQTQPHFNNMISEERFSQRQPVFPSAQISQPTFSQQTSFSHAQPVTQMRDTGSSGGW